MQTSKTVVYLCVLIAVLALVAAGAGLFWQDDGSSFAFTSLRGKTVQMYGRGLYRYDSLFSCAGYKGQDAVTLVLGIPLLLLFTVLYRRGSRRGGLLLTGILAYFLYVYATMSLGAAYNPLFLLYVALFGASFYAFVLVFTAVDLEGLPEDVLANLPRRGPAAYLFGAGLLTLFVWVMPLLKPLFQGEPLGLLDSSTTLVTHALDLALIVPATFVAGVLILQRKPVGYKISFALLGIIVMLLPVLTASTVSQISAGLSFTLGEVVGPVIGFAVLGLLAMGVMVAVLRRIPVRPDSSIPSTYT
jgi:hypothetical protein